MNTLKASSGVGNLYTEATNHSLGFGDLTWNCSCLNVNTASPTIRTPALLGPKTQGMLHLHSNKYDYNYFSEFAAEHVKVWKKKGHSQAIFKHSAEL